MDQLISKSPSLKSKKKELGTVAWGRARAAKKKKKKKKKEKEKEEEDEELKVASRYF
ncbi:hypothetical protein EJ02DRAFT_418508 [Clathrospora elynae]|uniref:Uncharacterized protein n=1 Tax=Clathrospora elynae TaxID=706981 RepID=A0A6A5T088_9PLEO|nr:hypothetical protein EJ02DRAFT_418508 [Clathrospora elynae]